MYNTTTTTTTGAYRQLLNRKPDLPKNAPAIPNCQIKNISECTGHKPDCALPFLANRCNLVFNSKSDWMAKILFLVALPLSWATNTLLLISVTRVMDWWNASDALAWFSVKMLSSLAIETLQSLVNSYVLLALMRSCHGQRLSELIQVQLPVRTTLKLIDYCYSCILLLAQPQLQDNVRTGINAAQRGGMYHLFLVVHNNLLTVYRCCSWSDSGTGI